MPRGLSEKELQNLLLEDLPSGSEASFCSTDDEDDPEGEEVILRKFIGEDIFADSDNDESTTSESANLLTDIPCVAVTDFSSQPHPSHCLPRDISRKQKTGGSNLGDGVQNSDTPCSARIDLPTQPTTSHAVPKNIPKRKKTRGSISSNCAQNNNTVPGNQFRSPPRTTCPKPKSLLWYAGKDNNYTNNIPQFLGNYAINIDGEEPYDFFIKIFTEEIFQFILTEANRFAFQNGKMTFKLAMNELKTFLGINIMMTFIKYPQVRMYWSSIEALRMNMIAKSMSVNRFEEIKWFIHFVNNDDKEDPVRDRYWKIRPIANMLYQTFHDAVSPTEHQSVDEMLVPFKGRSLLKQYLKGKPKKWGFKIWVRASVHGYVHCFELYEGAKTDTRSELGPVGDTVVRLCHGTDKKNHKLFIDNLFTSIPLLENLKAQDILVVGTVRLNRIPDVQKKLVNGKELSRGSCSIATSNSNMTAVRWKDTKEVHMLSTYAGAEPEDEVQRWDRKEKNIVTISRPFAIAEYNKFMGGVDLIDRIIAHYPLASKTKNGTSDCSFIS